MSVANLKDHGYSADVRMHLNVNGHSIRIGQLGPDFVIVDDAPDLPPSQAEITVSIDGRVRCWQVHLPDGVSGDKPRTRTTVVAVTAD